MKLKKKIPLIDQHDRNGFWGGRFGGNFILERCKENGLELDDSQITRGKAKVEELINTDPDWKQLINKIIND